MRPVPPGWQSARLGDVCEIVGGGTPKTGVPDYWGGDIQWITPADMSADRSQVLHGGARTLSLLGLASSPARVVPPGSVVISSRAPVGYVAIAGSRLATNQGCRTAIPPDEVDSRYLYWYLIAARSDLEARASGTTFKELSGREFAATRFSWPDVQEQRRIVDILEDHLSHLDAANNYLDAASRRVEALRASSLADLESPNDVPTPLGELARSSGYGSSAKCEVDGPGPVVVRIPNVQDGTIDLSDEKRVVDGSVRLEGLMLATGDLLIVRTNGSRNLIGRTAVVPKGVDAAFASYLIRYVLDETRVRPGWVHLMLERPSARQVLEQLAASSAGQYNLGLKKLDRVLIPLPPLDEQDRRARVFQDTAERLRATHRSTSAARLRAAALRRGLLAAAFTGQLTGCSSDTDRIEELVHS